MNCIKCGNYTNNPRFCSRSCSASHNNHLYPKRPKSNKPRNLRPKLNLQYICKLCGDNNLSNFYPTYRTTCKRCLRNKSKSRQLRFKQQCVKYKGGQCSLCGYNKCLQALDFHHVNITQKDFMISGASCCKFDDNIKLELDKCMLICSNCHRELHHQ